MANSDHVAVLKAGHSEWNRWRRSTSITPDLSGSDFANTYVAIPNLGAPRLNLAGVNLAHANFRGACLYRADCSGARLEGTDLRQANLQGVLFKKANLTEARLAFANAGKADFSQALCTDAEFYKTSLVQADFTDATLHGADLRQAFAPEARFVRANLVTAQLVETNLEGATLAQCELYGAAVWAVGTERCTQSALFITNPYGDNPGPAITVENIELAQFLFLLLDNRKLREVIDTITAKVVLVLGRFTADRKPALDRLRQELQRRNYQSVIFDFERPSTRDTLETISTLAHMSRFVIADLTDAKSVLQELQRIVPSLPSVPVQPLLLRNQAEPGMVDHFRNFRSFLSLHRYDDVESLVLSLSSIVTSAEGAAAELSRCG